MLSPSFPNEYFSKEILVSATAVWGVRVERVEM
jgi:hypothetical protein